jgi:hypothetical protein
MGSYGHALAVFAVEPSASSILSRLLGSENAPYVPGMAAGGPVTMGLTSWLDGPTC